MKKIVLNRQPIGVEDLAIGLGTQTQIRGGVEVTVTEINAGNLPFDETRTLIEFTQEVNLEELGNSVEAINNLNNDLTKLLNVEDNLPEVVSVAQNIVPNLAEILNVDTLASQVTQDKASVSSMKVAVETIYDTFDARFSIINTVDAFETVPSGIDTVIVKDLNRGGTFIYDATKSAINNGGTIFDGWVRQYKGGVYAEWFGAIGDGATDSTDAITNAIIKTTGKVNFGEGVFIVSGNLSRMLDGIPLRSNLTLEGIKGKTEIRSSLTITNTFKTPQNVTYNSIADVPKNITITGIKFTKPNAVWSDALENTGLLNISAVNGLTIRDCEFIGWQGDAIMIGFLSDDIGSDFMETFVENVSIYNNIFDGVTKDNRQAISIWDGINVSIHHNSFIRTTRSTGYAMPGTIDVEPARAYHKVGSIIISDNTFDDIGGTVGAVTIALATNMTLRPDTFVIKDNIFKNITNTSDIYIHGPSSAIANVPNSNAPINFEVSRNMHNNINRPYIVGGVENLTIEHDKVYNSKSSTIIASTGLTEFYPMNSFVMRDNIFKNCIVSSTIYEGPFYILGTLLNSEINNNTFIDCGNISSGTPVNMTVLQFDGEGLNSSNLSISGNSFINSGSFSVNSFPIRAGVLSNAETITVRDNKFIGLELDVYSSSFSIYANSIAPHKEIIKTGSNANGSYKLYSDRTLEQELTAFTGYTAYTTVSKTCPYPSSVKGFSTKDIYPASGQDYSISCYMGDLNTVVFVSTSTMPSNIVKLSVNSKW